MTEVETLAGFAARTKEEADHSQIVQLECLRFLMRSTHGTI